MTIYNTDTMLKAIKKNLAFLVLHVNALTSLLTVLMYSCRQLCLLHDLPVIVEESQHRSSFQYRLFHYLGVLNIIHWKDGQGKTMSNHSVIQYGWWRCNEAINQK